jgi:hypothetical protein
LPELALIEGIQQIAMNGANHVLLLYSPFATNGAKFVITMTLLGQLDALKQRTVEKSHQPS